MTLFPFKAHVRTWTVLWLVLGFAMYVLWDIFAENVDNNDTISVVTQQSALAHKIIIFALGCLLGHLLIVKGSINLTDPLVVLNAGILVGAILWGQTITP